jgi:sialic acid synthase SpsE
MMTVLPMIVMNSRSIQIGSRRIGEGHPCLIVAEAGSAHRGEVSRAFELIDAAGKAGADCVKFQVIFADEIVHPRTGSIELPGGRTPIYQRFRELERDSSFYARLKEYTEKRGLLFLCSAFGLRSARLLRDLGVRAVKVASPELNHFSLLRELAGYDLPLIVSTGVSTLSDIERALIAASANTVLLHCITAYPAPEEEYNLRLIPNLRAIFGLPVGVSDHSRDPLLVPALAVSVGACVIEKHLALLGDGIKRLAASERKYYLTTNRSLHAVDEIQAGQTIRAEDVSILRTESNLRPGLGPEYMELVVGRRAQRTIPAGEGITWEDVLPSGSGDNAIRDPSPIDHS